jgi:hypothetical protein
VHFDRDTTVAGVQGSLNADQAQACRQSQLAEM